MAIKKSELYSSLWQSCDELRGGMDASQYKDYVLVLLFIKYVSDKFGQRDSLLEVPDGAKFKDMVALKGKKDIGEKINTLIQKLADANDLRGVIDVADFDDAEKLGTGQAKVDRLTKLVGIFQNLDFTGNRADGDDLLGDAYEYLMRHFATESGKSKGQFYTPAEVSRVMAKVIGMTGVKSSNQSLYDPTCGSGSLLLRAHDEAKAATGVDVSIFGQEMDVSTRAMAKMNMILHNCPTADVRQENTLASPQFTNKDGSLKTFDFAVANPPFSTKAWRNGLNPSADGYGRFEYGIPPAKNGDYAFLLHFLASLKSTGKGAIILPHGVLFRANAEAEIRREIVRRGFLRGIIGLPANLFYGTGIPACILILDKAEAGARKHVFMIDASKGFIKDGSKNRLREQDIHKIVDTFNSQIQIAKYSRLVSVDEIAGNDYNLNIPRYVDSTEAEDLQDIDAHLNGGIPNRDIDDLSRYWKVFPGVRDSLFEPSIRPGYSQLKVGITDIKPRIFEHPEFLTFTNSISNVFQEWKESQLDRLMTIKVGDHPRALIDNLSESLLNSFKQVRLIDRYDVYQQLMSYWYEVMQDDVYMIVSDGWLAASKPRLIIEDKDKKHKEKPDMVIGKQKFKADLVPPALIIARYFADEQIRIEQKLSSLNQTMEEMKEEHTGEEGLLAEVADEGKIGKGAVKERLKEIKNDGDANDERSVLNDYLLLLNEETAANKQSKELEGKVAIQYSKLDEAAVKSLVVYDKWLSVLDERVHSELHSVSQALTGRVKQLAERYAKPLPDLTDETETLAARVAEHLRKMSVPCN
jgi:type I restriction enzyme M protein